MSVKFNIVQRGNPANPQAPRKHYPSIQSSGRLSIRQLANEIADISTVSTVDTMAVLEAMLTVIPHELGNGNIVELGDFGNFWLRSTAAGAAKPEQVRATHVTGLLPRFNPGKEFKRMLQDVKFEKA